MTGITGQFFRQFALTIAVSTAISAFNSLTLSPALGAHPAQAARREEGLVAARARRAARLVLPRLQQSLRVELERLRQHRRPAHPRSPAIVLLVYAGLLALTGARIQGGARRLHSHAGSRLRRRLLRSFPTPPRSIARKPSWTRCAKIARETPGVLDTIEIAGFNLFGGNQPNTGAVFLPFKDFAERNGAGRADAGDSREAQRARTRRDSGGVRRRLSAAAGGRHRQCRRLPTLHPGPRQRRPRGTAKHRPSRMMMKANETPGLAGNLTTFRANVPQLWLEVDRVKAKTHERAAEQHLRHAPDLSRLDLRQRLQPLRPHLSRDRAGRRAVPPHARRHPPAQDAQRRRRHGPARLRRHRAARSAARTKSRATTCSRPPTSAAQPAPGSAPARRSRPIERLAKEILPTSFTTEWTELALQQKLAGNSALYIFPLCVLFVFLVLAAQYESWSLPLAIILIVPMCLLSAIGGVWLRDDGQQHLHANRLRRARRPRVQERHPHRRVRASRSRIATARIASPPRSKPAACACARS